MKKQCSRAGLLLLLALVLLVAMPFSMQAAALSYRAADTEAVQAAKTITAENFASKDRLVLEAAKADIEQALAEDEDGYTEAERQTLLDELARIDAVLLCIERVEVLQQALDALPAPQGYHRNDEAVNELIEVIQSACAQLTPREAELVNTSRLEAILRVLSDYDIVFGNGSQWQKGSDFSLSFQANGPYAEFVGVKIDGVLLDQSNYLAIDRDTAVNLLAPYLETLPLGEHTITILYAEDEAAATFSITEAVAARTDNSRSWIVLVILLLCSAGGVVAYRVLKGQKRKKKRTQR